MSLLIIANMNTTTMRTRTARVLFYNQQRYIEVGMCFNTYPENLIETASLREPRRLAFVTFVYVMLAPKSLCLPGTRSMGTYVESGPQQPCQQKRDRGE